MWPNLPKGGKLRPAADQLEVERTSPKGPLYFCWVAKDPLTLTGYFDHSVCKMGMAVKT